MQNKISHRAKNIAPFHVMDILAQAKKLESQGQSIIHMEVGEPDFVTPEPIVEAGIAALRAGHTKYTSALGLPALREAIAGWYQHYYGVSVSTNRIIVTPGASGALLLVMGALLDKGKNVLLADPGYPCNKNFARFVEGEFKSIPVDATTDYQLSVELIRQYWDDNTEMVLLASPSNPTGTVLTQNQLTEIAQLVASKQGHLVVDEIYHGLTYDDFKAPTALAVSDKAFVINSFSKYFGMTGWRLGWLVVPEAYEATMDRLAQNLFLAAPTMSQYAALTAFTSATQEILAYRRQLFEQRRNILLPAITALGFRVDTVPKGAFYLYANCEQLLNDRYKDSMALAKSILAETGVAITPGLDFGTYQSDKYCRFAYTTDAPLLLDACSRMASFFKS